MFISISYVRVFVQYHQMVLVWPTSLLVLPSFTRSVHQRAHNNNTVKVRKVVPPLGETHINAQSTTAVTRSQFLRRLPRDHAQTAAVWKALPA